MSRFQFKAWPTQYKKISQHFGANPQNYAQFGLPGHEGVDIRAPSGTPIMCVAAGVVSRVHREPNNHNYGLHIRIKHQDGYETVYAHLQETHVYENQELEAGDVIGLADNTGNSFGSHLHLTLKKKGAKQDGWPAGIIDPTPFLLPLMGWQRPHGPYLDGWVSRYGVHTSGELAQAADDITLRISPDDNVLIPLGTILIVENDTHPKFLYVKVAQAAVGLDSIQVPTKPAPLPPHNIRLYYGWARVEQLNRVGNRGIVNTPYGVALRVDAAPYAHAIGLIRYGSTVSVVGRAENGYLPIKVPRIALRGSVNPTEPLPKLPLTGVDDLPDSILWGWINKQDATLSGVDLLISHFGTTLRSAPQRIGKHIATIYGDAPAQQIGREQSGFLPIMVGHQNIVQLTTPVPERIYPDLLTAADIDQLQTEATTLPHKTAAGWAFTSSVKMINKVNAVVNPDGLNLRTGPQRNSKLIGYIPAGIELFITDEVQGEFLPVRVDESYLEPPRPDLEELEMPLLGQARIGLHASADPDITDAEHREFAHLRPGIIKVLSFHSEEDIRRLAQAHPKATWVVRAFLDFGGRHITPARFLHDTISDVERALRVLNGRDVVIELHNEPNLTVEGLYSSWQDSFQFNEWWLELLTLYRQRLPDQRYIFPGLSPGSSVSNLKIDHIQFIEACRPAVTAADGLGVHLYWSHVYPMSQSLMVLDDYISRFRSIPIWVTEASNNKGERSAEQKGEEYLQFWQALQQRPVVQGVTYFVASASHSGFQEEVWVGRGIGKIVGRR